MTTAVGIDVVKAGLDLSVDGVPGVVRFANGRVGIGKLVAKLGKPATDGGRLRPNNLLKANPR